MVLCKELIMAEDFHTTKLICSVCQHLNVLNEWMNEKKKWMNKWMNTNVFIYTVNKNNRNFVFCSEFSIFLKLFSMNCGWRIIFREKTRGACGSVYFKMMFREKTPRCVSVPSRMIFREKTRGACVSVYFRMVFREKTPKCLCVSSFQNDL